MYYMKCAMNCVGNETLKKYKMQFEQCNQNFDLLFSTETNDDDFYRKVIEPGHIYETGYPRCLCWLDNNGKDKCECSRQALIYLYSQLAPNKKINVETKQTITKGAKCCVFHITVE